jgi:hypothetical protein
VRDDQDPLDTEQVHAEHQGLECGARDPAPRVAEDLGVAMVQSEHAQRIDPRVHAGDDRHAGVCHTVEAAEIELGRELLVCCDQVFEVFHARNRSGASAPSCHAPAVRMPTLRL